MCTPNRRRRTRIQGRLRDLCLPVLRYLQIACVGGHQLPLPRKPFGHSDSMQSQHDSHGPIQLAS